MKLSAVSFSLLQEDMDNTTAMPAKRIDFFILILKFEILLRIIYTILNAKIQFFSHSPVFFLRK